MPTVTFTIDGKEATVEQGTTIMQAADQLGVFIPRFCYHPGLSIAGNCRICLVEVEKMPKLATACSTTVGDGMVVHTDNEKVKKARTGVLELMLVEHPIDCPVCDQAGECYLQDNYMKIGLHKSRYKFPKAAKPKVVDLPPHIVLDAERCILCSRCVRFSREVTKTGEFAIGRRGNHAEIDTFAHRGLDNGYVGNLHQTCPVGALTSREFRFKCRVWWLKSTESVCPGCSTGCNIFVEAKEGKVCRLQARENRTVNDFWICDAGRYNYKFINADDRVAAPKIKRGGKLVDSAWNETLELVNKKIAAAKNDGKGFVGVASAALTNEELYLFKKLASAAGGETDFRFGDEEKNLDKREDDLLLRADKNPNTKGASLLGLGGAKNVADLLKKAGDKTGVLYLLDANAADRAGLADTIKGLREKIDFIVMHATHDCKLLELADVVIAESTYAEKEGTFTNYEGRVQKIKRAIKMVGKSRPALSTLGQLLAGLDESEAGVLSASEVFAKMASENKPFENLNYDQLAAEGAVVGG